MGNPMSDLIARLRALAKWADWLVILDEAAAELERMAAEIARLKSNTVLVRQQSEIERLQAENKRLRKALDRLPITSHELIRLRNEGKITFDKQVYAIIDCLLKAREALREPT
jgi:hypothetical protein